MSSYQDALTQHSHALDALAYFRSTVLMNVSDCHGTFTPSTAFQVACHLHTDRAAFQRCKSIKARQTSKTRLFTECSLAGHSSHGRTTFLLKQQLQIRSVWAFSPGIKRLAWNVIWSKPAMQYQQFRSLSCKGQLILITFPKPRPSFSDEAVLLCHVFLPAKTLTIHDPHLATMCG